MYNKNCFQFFFSGSSVWWTKLVFSNKEMILDFTTTSISILRKISLSSVQKKALMS